MKRFHPFALIPFAIVGFFIVMSVLAMNQPVRNSRERERNNITFVDNSPPRFDVYGYEHAGHKYIVFINAGGHAMQVLEEKTP